MNVRKILVIAIGAALAGAGAVAANPMAPGPIAERIGASDAPEAHEAPIVSGRSVGVRHKSRLHHVRMRNDARADASSPDALD